MMKILCPFHKEGTPSCAVYKDHFRCYACGESGLLERLGMRSEQVPDEPPKEDLEKSFRYINSLPYKEVRGMQLPADDRSYYIAWPDQVYYKRRFFKDGQCKYVGASGHKKPPFWLRTYSTAFDTLVIVEGEINAISVKIACPEFAVMSPGGVGDFTPHRAKQYLQSTIKYSTILIVADNDAPGAQAAIQLMGELRGRGRKVYAKLMAPDANDVLTGEGSGRLKEIILQAIRDGEQGTEA